MTLFLLLLLKTLAVFAVSGLALLALRRASASARHLVCLLTLLALLALPLFSLTLPIWRLPVLSAPTARPVPAAPLAAVAAPQARSTPENIPPAPNNGGAGKEPIVVGIAPTHPLPIRITPPVLEVGWLLLLYPLGFLLALVRPLLGLQGIAHLRRTCVSMTDTPTLALSAECAATLRLSRPITLGTADVPVPMTWGWRRPVVLLPLASERWPADRTRAVLLHEMAHIKRRDWLSHRLADCVCAVYWFHPLAWLTARRLRAEGEIACDDLVLASGIAAPDYARHLLDIARALPPSNRLFPSAIAMAQTSQIEGRLKMILDRTQSRRTLTRRVLRTALGLGTISLVTLAIIRPTAKAQSAYALIASVRSASPRPVGLSIATMNFDVKPLLAGVTDSKGPGGKWWSASGMPLPKPVFDTVEAYQHVGYSTSPGQRSVMFAFRLPAAAQGVTVEYHVPRSTNYGSDGEWPGKSESDAGHTEAQVFASTGGARIMTAALPRTLRKTFLSVGIASGAWKTTASELETPGALEPFGGTGAAAYESTFILAPPVETATGLVLMVSTNSTRDIRVIAIDKQGTALFPTSVGSESTNTLTQITAHFPQPLAQIKEFRVETRPFVWTEFKNVALQPAQ